MKIGRVEVTASRWPWQDGFGWRSRSDRMRAPLNNGARFGAGWRWKLGVDVGTRSVLFNLVFGMVTFRWLRRPCVVCGGKKFSKSCGFPQHPNCGDPDVNDE